MANKLNLYIVSDDKSLVQSTTNGGAFSLPPLVQNDVTAMSLALMEKDPAGGLTAPFRVDKTQQTVRVGIVTPNSVAATVHALGTLFYASPAGTYSGSLSLATQEIATLLGSSTQVQSTFEIEVTGVGNSVFTVQKPVTIAADGLKGSAPISISGSQSFYDASTTDSLFLRRTGAASVQAPWDVQVIHGAAASVAKFTRDTDAKVFNFGSWTGAAWSNNADTLTTRGDVLLISGGTLTGEAHLAANPSHGNALTRKSYVDATALSGGTYTGTIIALRDPVLELEVATKRYVQNNSGQPQIQPGLVYEFGTRLAVDFAFTGSQVGFRHLHETSQVLEQGGPLYFTAQRVRDTALTGIDTTTQGVVSASDSLLTSIGKLQATKVSTSAGTFSHLVRFPYSTPSQPAITNPTGEDTGIFFPSTDVNAVAISNSAAEVARFSEGGLSIGSTSHLARLGVVGGANEVQLAVRANSTQTTDVIRTSDSSGNTKARINQYHGLNISTDGLAAGDTKGVRITASSASGAASLELVNSIGGSPSVVELTGPSQTPSNTLVIENRAAGDVQIKTDGIGRVTVKESGNVEVSNLVLKATGGISTEGGMWQNSSTKSVKSYIAGIEQALPGVLFTGSADKQIANTTSETSIVPTGTGALTLPANFWTAGKTIRVTLIGLLRSKAASPGLFTAKVKLGSTVIATTGGFALDAALSDVITNIELLMTCRSTGVGGTIRVIGTLEHLGAGVTYRAVKLFTQGGGMTADTTASALLDLTGQFSVSDVANTWTTVDCSFEVLN